MKSWKPSPAGVVTAVLIALSLALVPVAFAGKGGGGGGGTRGGGGGGGSYSVTVTPGSPYSFGEMVYISTTYPQVSGSYIALACYQNGALVGSWTHANWSGGWYYNWGYVLGPTQSWLSGAADCTATVTQLSNNKSLSEGSTSFHVDG